MYIYVVRSQVEDLIIKYLASGDDTVQEVVWMVQLQACVGLAGVLFSACLCVEGMHHLVDTWGVRDRECACVCMCVYAGRVERGGKMGLEC